MFKKLIQLSLVVLAVLAVTLTSITDPAYAAKSNPTIIPPDANYRGKSYGEWAASWWQALFAVPMDGDSHPYLNGGLFHVQTNAKGKKGVAFLAAVGPSATIDVTIPAGTALFVPVINTECSVFEPDPYHGDDEASLRACANGHIDQTSGLNARLDGKRVQDLETYRVESPLFQWGPLPEGNLFAFFGMDAPAGTTSDSVDAGVYLLIAPLPVGEHTLRVRGTFDDSGASIDTKFKIAVTPK